MDNNRTVLPFTIEELEKFEQILLELENTYKSKFESLTSNDRMKLLKMRDKSMPFVSKTIEYGRDFESVIPPALDMNQLEADFIQAQKLDSVVRRIEKLQMCMNDTRMVMADRVYGVALTAYYAIRGADRLNVPGIKKAIDELSKRFSGQGNVRSANTSPIPEEITPSRTPKNNNINTKTETPVSWNDEDINVN